MQALDLEACVMEMLHRNSTTHSPPVLPPTSDLEERQESMPQGQVPVAEQAVDWDKYVRELMGSGGAV
jgi:hypothetical protein